MCSAFLFQVQAGCSAALLTAGVPGAVVSKWVQLKASLSALLGPALHTYTPTCSHTHTHAHTRYTQLLWTAVFSMDVTKFAFSLFSMKMLEKKNAVR